MAKKKPQPKAASTKILFVGNSFTQRNNMPGLLAEMAAGQDRQISHQLISVGGASLRTHWNGETAAATIASGGFDYVVLQEQSTLPVKNATRMAENIRLFDAAIKDAGAQTVLYMTWARQHSPENQPVISDAYNRIGAELDAIVVPVGSVWTKFRAKHASPELYDPDQSHPTLAGSYLAACVFLSRLLRCDLAAVKTGPAGLGEHAAKLLRTFAARDIGS